MLKWLGKWVMAYARWARASQTRWARWHFYAGLVTVYALICLAASKLEVM